jgi:hypothetical protein
LNDGAERWERDRKRLSEVKQGQHTTNKQQILFLIILVCLYVCGNALNNTTQKG